MRPIDFTASHSAPPGHADQLQGWWQNPWLLLALVLGAALPVLICDIAPLTDLPGHMARYRVMLDGGDGTALGQYYEFRWALVGNLGLDLLVIPLAHLFGLEPAVRILVAAIPVLTSWGFLLVAREVHGRIPPTAFFALPFAYGYPFMFGFVNFALSMAFAFLAFGLWLHLARRGQTRLRAILFPFIATLVWLTHTFGWGTLGVLCFSAELVRQFDRGRDALQALGHAILHCLSLLPPVLLIILWRGEHGGGTTGDWFNWRAKWLWIQDVLRDRWYWFDTGALIAVALLLARALWSPRIEFSRNLAASMAFLALVYICLPRVIFGSAYADMRIVPFIFATAVIAIRLKARAGPNFASLAAGAAIAFAVIRLIGTGTSFYLYDKDYDRVLAALDRVPPGAAMVSFVGRTCRESWATTRLEHLPGIAAVRRHAFSNDQWEMPGGQLLSVRAPPAGYFRYDPSEIVTPVQCRYERWLSIDRALRDFPRTAFNYVWLINAPPFDPSLTDGLYPLWRDGDNVLYRVDDRRSPDLMREER